MLDESHGDLGGAPAGFWRRFAATFIDGIVLAIVSSILQAILGRVPGFGLGLLIAGSYFTYFHGKTGQSPGDAVASIRVVDVRDQRGQPIGYSRALMRWVMSYVSAAVLLLGYLWMLWDGEKQTWHDKVAGSVPVYVG